MSDFAVCGLTVLILIHERWRLGRGVLLMLSPTMFGGAFLVTVGRLAGWRVAARYPSRGDQGHRRGRQVGRLGSGPHIAPSPGQLGEQDEFEVVHVPNAVRRPRDRRRGVSADSGRFLFVGRLVQSKRPEVVMTAWGQIAPVLPGWCVDFIGDGGDERSSVEDVLRQMLDSGTFPRCRLQGALPDTADALARSDILVFPSVTEGLPNGMLEAMAAGVPVIADPALVRSWFGRDVPLLAWDGEERSLGEAMLQAAQDTTERWRVAAEGRRFVSLYHDPELVADQFAVLLTEGASVGRRS